MREPLINWSYLRRGGLRFFSLGRLGFCFYIRRAG